MPAKQTLANKTFVVLFVLCLLVAGFAAVAATAASFSSYEKEAEQLLLAQTEEYAETLSDLDEDQMIGVLRELPFVETRCTLVAEDGTVLYDNYVDAETLDNHADREEIEAAREGNDVALMRRSVTLGTDSVYAATEVRDGIVLRLAETRTSLASFLGGMAWQLLISLIVITVLAYFASRRLTEMIVKPLREINLAKPLENRAYEELQPLLERVNAQRLELEQHNYELEQAVAMRREFTGNVSHEMKSPLQVIGGYAELIEQGVVPPEDIPRFAGLIRSESETMRRLIDDMLTLSRLDENADKVSTPVYLSEVCRRVVVRLEATAEERGEAVELNLDDGAVVLGNEAYVEQMLYNLVENAIKYNRDGGTVRLDITSDGERARIVVADEGPGIPEDQRERIFERFYRLDASRSRETGGTGLGLAIVKHAVETVDGSIEIEDSRSGGAVFIVSIPAARPDSYD